MDISANGQRLIEQFEGRKTVAYLDGGGVPTNGIGHTAGVFIGQVVTEALVDQWFAADIFTSEQAVRQYVTHPVTQNQFDAMVSLAFNIGVGAFAKSTLVRKLNDGDVLGAADQFPRWNQDNGKVVPGLSRRRAAERSLFLTP